MTPVKLVLPMSQSLMDALWAARCPGETVPQVIVRRLEDHFFGRKVIPQSVPSLLSRVQVLQDGGIS